MKLIAEAIENVEYICEENDGNKNYKIRGIFMQGDIKNRNGRVYPMEVLTKEVKNYKKTRIKNQNKSTMTMLKQNQQPRQIKPKLTKNMNNMLRNKL